MIYKNEFVLTHGQHASLLYKLTQGKALYYDKDMTAFREVTAPCYLNLTEVIHSAPTLKTVKGIGKFHIIKTRLKDTHKHIITQLKEQGLKKSKFIAFSPLPLHIFYELALMGVILSARKHQSKALKENHIYLIVKGVLIVSGKQHTLKLAKFQEGEILFTGSGYRSIQALSDTLTLLELSLHSLKCILGDQYTKIASVFESQKNSLDLFQTRNQRLSQKIKTDNVKQTESVHIPAQFANQALRKLQFVDDFCRAKSCHGTLHKTRIQIRSQNAARFKEFIEFNRKKYGQEYITHKRYEINSQIYATCPSSPTSSYHNIPTTTSTSTPTSTSLPSYQKKKIYESIKSHPMIEKWQVLRSGQKGRLKKVGREGREPGAGPGQSYGAKLGGY